MSEMAEISIIIFQTTFKRQWQLNRGWILCNSLGLFWLNGWRRHLTSIFLYMSILCLRIFNMTCVCLIIIRLLCWTNDFYSNSLFIWCLYFLVPAMVRVLEQRTQRDRVKVSSTTTFFSHKMPMCLELQPIPLKYHWVMIPWVFCLLSFQAVIALSQRWISLSIQVLSLPAVS